MKDYAIRLINKENLSSDVLYKEVAGDVVAVIAKYGYALPLELTGEGKEFDSLFERVLRENIAEFPATTVKLLDIYDEEQRARGAGTPAAETFIVAPNHFGGPGAAVVLYPGVLDAIAYSVDDDLFVLPASIEEVLVIPEHTKDSDGLRRIVMAVNQECDDDGRFLSNGVFRYDRKTKRITAVK